MAKNEQTEEKEVKTTLEEVKTTFEEIKGVGVLVTSIYKDCFAQNFIPGTKIKDEKIVSINA